MENVTTAHLTMNTGRKIPSVGLGVFQNPPGPTTYNAVLAALQAGYRHIDTARVYGNERDVGQAMRDSGIPREEIFVTTKLWNSDQGYDQSRHAFDASLGRLGLEYVDLFLIHWPIPVRRLESWHSLERVIADGQTKALGVSNFMRNHLVELLGDTSLVPAVNQIEVSPFHQQRDPRALCAERGIVVEAYSPLTKGERLAHPTVVGVAQKAGRTPAQVMLRWGLQHGMVVLPKSTHPERIAENAALFDFTLDDEAMAALDALEEGHPMGWDPYEAEVIPIILASGSPRRRQLLSELGYALEIIPADLDETRHLDEEPEAYALRLARAKAQTVASSHPARTVVAADTIVIAEGDVLGKPQDAQDFARMMRLLSGRTHEVLTAVAVQGVGEKAVRTTVSFRGLSSAEISWYWSTGEPRDKAGGYALQGLAGAFIRRIDGSCSNVIGLPLIETVELLSLAGVPAPWGAK